MLLSFSTIALAIFTVLSSRLAYISFLTYTKTKQLEVPGIFFVFGLPWRFMLPNIRLLNPKNRTVWTRKFAKYEELGMPIIKTFALFGGQRQLLQTADPGVVKQLSINRKVWSKPVGMYTVLSFFGQNLVITEGPEWKVHRKVVGPSFSEKAYDLVWQESAKVFDDMVQGEGWAKAKSGDKFHLKDFVEITMRIALLIIARAAFNIDMPWAAKDEADTPLTKGHTMTSSHALHLVSTKVIWKILTPKWLYDIPIPYLQPRLLTVRTAFSELDAYMYEMIDARREAFSRGEEGKADLFGTLVKAGMESDEKAEVGEDEDAKGGLGSREIVGNTFIFLLAGHETSGHSLGFLFTFLALHPEVQQELYKQTIEVMPHGHEPTYEDYPKLTYALAVFYETIRLFPPVTDIPKVSTTDTTLTYQTIPDARGDTTTESIFVPKGTECMIDTSALHCNPLHWTDPHTFNPSRFLPGADWNRDAFVPFSAGPRACIGRRFAEVEVVATISLFIRDFEFSLPPLRKGEDEEGRKARLMKATPAITLTPGGVDLVITKR